MLKTNKKAGRPVVSGGSRIVGGTTKTIAPKQTEEPVVVEPVVEEVIDEMEEEIVEEVVQQPVATKTSKKPTLGKPKQVKSEKKTDEIGRIYPREVFVKNVLESMLARWEGVSKADAEYMVKVVEEKFIEAASTATFRFAGGLARVSEANARVTNPPKADTKILIGDRKRIYYSKDIEQVEKWQGDWSDQENKIFQTTAKWNYETKSWEECDDEFKLNS